MISVNGSTYGLKKSMQSLADRLSKLQSLSASVDVFNCGPNGEPHYGPSYVRLNVVGKNLVNEEVHIDIKVFCGGYGDIVTWSEVKASVLAKIGLDYNADNYTEDRIFRLELQ